MTQSSQVVWWRLWIAVRLERLAQRFSRWSHSLRQRHWEIRLSSPQTGEGFWCAECHYAVMRHDDGKFYWHHDNVAGRKREVAPEPYSSLRFAANRIVLWEGLGCRMRPYRESAEGNPCA